MYRTARATELLGLIFLSYCTQIFLMMSEGRLILREFFPELTESFFCDCAGTRAAIIINERKYLDACIRLIDYGITKFETKYCNTQTSGSFFCRCFLFAPRKRFAFICFVEDIAEHES